MYSINGDFGKVRLCRLAITKYNFPVPYKLITGGWHKCNDKYFIQREHGREEFVFLFNISSGGIAQIENQKWNMKANSIILLPPNIYHQYYTDIGQEWEFYWLCAVGPDLNKLLTQITEEHGFYFENMELKSIIEKYETLFPERFIDTSEIYDITASHIVSEILHDFLFRIHKHTHRQNPSHLVSTLLQELETNYGNELNIQNIAVSHNVSTQYLIRLFKTETGHTPYEYLKKYRLLKAGELLIYSPKNIAEIAAETGFSSTSNFIAQFKKEKNITPGNYRSSRKKERLEINQTFSKTSSLQNHFKITPTIERAISYIEEHYNASISLTQVAEYCYISEVYLSRAFKKATGQTFSQYITTYRLKKAVELLANHHTTILDIALQTGFQNFSYFIRVFKKEYGVTPGYYRKSKFQ